MLAAIVRFSLRYRIVVLTVAVLLLIYGCFTAKNAKLDVFPDFVPPQVTIETESPGLTAEQVETLVTRPLESALNGLGYQEALRSDSIQGLSVVTVVFKEGTSILAARQLLNERLAAVAGSLPLGVKSPTLSPLTSATMDLLKIGLISDTQSPQELRRFADLVMEPKLLAVSGVAKATIFGGEVPQWQIRVRPESLAAHGVSLADVVAAAKTASGVRGVGFIDTANQRIVLESEGQIGDAATLGDALLTVTGGGTPLRLRDVATVELGHAQKYGDALIMGRPGIMIAMASQYGSNTLDVTTEVEKALDEMRPLLAEKKITLYDHLHRPASFIESSLHHIRISLLLGAVLVTVVLFLFLGQVRTALISLVAIPLSLLTAIVVLSALGISLNTITLGGLAIAIGEVVDDAIIDVENILRRLRENASAPQPRSAISIVFHASLEVRSAVVFATFMVVLVFLPVLALSGLQGSFFSPLAASYILAILASLLVALTVTPALTLLCFPRGPGQERVPWLQARLRRGYEGLIRWVLPRSSWVIAIVLIGCALCLARIFFFQAEFLPEFREGHFVLSVKALPGTSLAESRRIGAQISAQLLQLPAVATVEEQIGRAAQGEDIFGTHQAEFHVELKPDLPGAQQAKTEDEIRALLTSVPGIQSEVMTFLGDRIGESISGETAPIVVNLFGTDLDALDTDAQRVAGALRSIPGIADVQVKAPPGAPKLLIRLLPRRLAALGLHTTDLLETLEAAFQGTSVGQTYHGNETLDILVTLAEPQRSDLEGVRHLWLSSSDGQKIQLGDVAEVALTTGRFAISHEGARRRQTVTANVSGRNVGAAALDVREKIGHGLKLSPGVYAEFTGEAEAGQAGTRQLMLNSAIVSVGIVLLLFAVLGHWRNLLLVLANLPLALAGGVLAVGLGGGALSMGAMVGFVTLFGISTRNAIMLVSHYSHLVNEEGAEWNVATAIRGASERLAPILMTASVTALGLLPLALGSGEAGREIEGPMAVVILGGLCSSTLLNLLVLPAAAFRWGRFASSKEEAELIE